jgi:hypothetical protein
VAGTSPSFLYRNLLAEVPKGTPLDTRALRARGLTAKQLARYAESGWLRRLGHGVYALPGETLDRDACLAWLGTVVPGLHVGAKTALGWWGIRHHVAFQERLHLWGDKPLQLPPWFTAAFPATYQTTQLFDAALAPGTGLAALPAGHPQVLVSVPERALLELLSDVGKTQSLDEASQLLEASGSVRANVLDELLAHVQRIKVARLAHMLADELDLPWRSIARQHSERLGGGRRWVSTTRSGERLHLKRPQ